MAELRDRRLAKLSLPGDGAFEGPLGGLRDWAKGEGAGLARELGAALVTGMPNVGRGALLLAVGAVAFQSVFMRSSILIVQMSGKFQH